MSQCLRRRQITIPNNHSFEADLMRHVMLDVEAFGKPTTGTLLQVGAVLFDRDAPLAQFDAIGPDRRFLATIRLESVDLSRIDPITLRWWLTETDDSARSSVFTHDGIEDSELLSQFNTFMIKSDPSLVISSQPSYDIGHLYALYARHDRRVPWEHRTEHGTRELRQLAQHAGVLATDAENPIQHNAFHDALAQAKDYTKTWQALKAKISG